MSCDCQPNDPCDYHIATCIVCSPRCVGHPGSGPKLRNRLSQYEVRFENHRGNIAVAKSFVGYEKALQDKTLDPTLPFNVVELVTHGSVRASLMWHDGRWR